MAIKKNESLVHQPRSPYRQLIAKREKWIALGRKALKENNISKAINYFRSAECSEGIDEVIVKLLRLGKDEQAKILFDRYNKP
jgi:uncharacterized protein HemY